LSASCPVRDYNTEGYLDYSHPSFFKPRVFCGFTTMSC